MDIKLKTFFSLIGIAIFTIMFLVLYEIFRLYQVTTELSVIADQRYEMILKADELRQSSDDLTKMARSYMITQNQEYKDAYFRILNIRDGKEPRPKNYEGIYWDLPKGQRDILHPLEKNSSLEKAMQELPYSEYERQMLLEAKINSDELARLEQQAFEDNRTDFTLPTSIALLFSPQYSLAKTKIMLPIDHFLTSIRQRTEHDIIKTHSKVNNIYKEITFLFFLSAILLFMVVYVLRKKVLKPIEYLHNTILAFKNNDANIQKQHFYQDEIGQMIEQFFQMKKRIDMDNEKLRHLATTDPLTKVYNRRAFFDIANSFFILAKRTDVHLSIMILDIDFFKKINDNYGHIIGDTVLQKLVGSVEEKLRESDIFARYGGEEFIVMLPHTDIDAAQHVAQKIRKAIEETPYNVDSKDIYVTISIGCSSYKREDSSLNEVILRADRALYKAKKNGRNRVEVII
jgi:diguanylate cyclase (GGDEF)-like protein